MHDQVLFLKQVLAHFGKNFGFSLFFSSDVNKNNEDEHQKALFNGMVKIEGLFV